ncbi:hypothetical protein GCM10027575_64000 [Phytohabitans suffuscus]
MDRLEPGPAAFNRGSGFESAAATPGVLRTVAPATSPSAVRTITLSLTPPGEANQTRPQRIVRPAKARIMPLSRGVGTGWIVPRGELSPIKGSESGRANPDPGRSLV